MLSGCVRLAGHQWVYDPAVDDALRVLVVEDDTFTASLLTRTLSGNGWHVIGPACDSAGALHLVDDGSRPDVALLDLDLGAGPDGLELAVALRDRLTDIGVVLLTSYPTPRLFRPDRYEVPVGVRVLAKSDITDVSLLDGELRAAIISPRTVNSGAMSPVRALNGAVLTDRQVVLMRLVADGLSNSAIADRLDIAESSVEKAISRLIKRLDLNQGDEVNPRVMLARAVDILTRRRPD